MQISDLFVFPNPTTEYVQIEKSHTKTAFKIKLFDFFGNVLMNNVVHSDDKIDLSKFSSGIYLLNINDGENSKNIKIIKK